MPRPIQLSSLPGHITDKEMVDTNLEAFFSSLSKADKLAFLNAIRSGAAFNFDASD